MSQVLRNWNHAAQYWNESASEAWARDRIYAPSLWDTRDAEVRSKMKRLDVIRHALDHRASAVAGKTWTMVPRNEASPRAPLAVAVGTELVNRCKKLSNSLRLLAQGGCFDGNANAYIHTKPIPLDIGDGVWRTWMVPVKLEDQHHTRYRKFSRDPYAEKPIYTWQRWETAGAIPQHGQDGRWVDVDRLEAIKLIRHVYNDDEESMGFGNGLADPLGWLWYAYTNVNQESLGAIEKFARGWVVGKVNSLAAAEATNTNTTLATTMRKKLKDMQSKGVLVIDSEDEVDVLFGSGQGWEMLKDYREDLANRMRTLILSGNLPTSANEGGSYALADTQADSGEMLFQYDRDALEETLTDDLMTCLWYENHANLVELGLQDDMPRFSITPEKKEDPEVLARVAQTVNQMGGDISKKDLYERLGLKVPEPGEEVIEGASAQPMPGFGFPGPTDNGMPQPPQPNQQLDPFGAGVPQ